MKKKQKKELEKKFIEMLYGHLNAHTYEMSLGNEGFWFKNDESEIHVFQNIKYQEALFLDFRYFVQNKTITELIEKVSKGTMPSWQSGSYFYNTSSKEYGSVISEMVDSPEFDNPPLYKIENELQIKNFIDHQTEYLDRVVFKYFRHFKNLESIYGFLAPYILDLTEDSLENIDEVDTPWYPYININECCSLMISSWIIQRANYEEIWRRIKKIYEPMFVFKKFEFLDKVLREEYTD